MKLCSKCNSPVDEKEDKTIFYCDNCLIEVSEAVQKISNWIDNLK